MASPMHFLSTDLILREPYSYPNKIDLLIVGIPPLELTPYHQNLANHDSEKLELLEIVCLQYNHELSIASKAMKKEFNKGKSATRVNVFYYDMAGLVRLSPCPNRTQGGFDS